MSHAFPERVSECSVMNLQSESASGLTKDEVRAATCLACSMEQLDGRSGFSGQTLVPLEAC